MTTHKKSNNPLADDTHSKPKIVDDTHSKSKVVADDTKPKVVDHPKRTEPHTEPTAMAPKHTDAGPAPEPAAAPAPKQSHDEMQTSFLSDITSIDNDIQTVLDKLRGKDGGLAAPEVAELRNILTNLKARTKQTRDKVVQA